MSPRDSATSKENKNNSGLNNASSVTLRDVSKSYGEEWLSDDVLKDVSIDFPAGELTVICRALWLWKVYACEHHGWL